MFDPRDDARDRDEGGRERAYEGPDQTGDPRDVFLHDANRRDRGSDDDNGQAFHAGVLREREIEHDASMYEAFRAEEKVKLEGLFAR
jgi:hypothetical protein